MSRPLFITRDDSLLEDLLRLTAAAGVSADVARDGATALRGWSAAPLVLLGADLAEELAHLSPVRRPGVHVVAWGAIPDDLFRLALAVGAENVAELPRSGAWVTETLTDLGESARRDARVVGVVGGSGGAGATTFACALGQVAARAGTVVVIDTDPLGPGLDRVLGLDQAPGVRWAALCDTTGRLSARSLREALPRRENLAALTWSAGSAAPLQPFAVREALSAARRGHETVVVDLPRSLDPLTEELVSRCDLLVMVVTATVAGVASATRLAARLPDRSTMRLAVRGRGIEPEQVARVTEVPHLTAMGDQRGLAEAIDLGLGPVRTHRSPLGRAAREVLARAAATVAAA
jgi:secretion/DNA translocation related CpaE-like protein